MPDSHAKTIQIFLPTGEPRGIRVAEVTSRIAQAVLIPRSDLAVAKQRPELDQLAVYMLFGESDQQAKPIVYIGQTENPRQRLDNHNANKDFWTTAILGISRTNSFTHAHIRYLEWHCLDRAKQIGRFLVDNDQEPTKPFVPEALEADALDSFDTLNTLVSALGYPVFEPIVRSESTDMFFCRGPDADGRGELVEDGFVVREGSIARKEIVDSAVGLVAPLQAKLLESGVLVVEDERLRFRQDYLFSSPSAAASMVLAKSANGWVMWKNKEGRTSHDMKRAPGNDG